MARKKTFVLESNSLENQIIVEMIHKHPDIASVANLKNSYGVKMTKEELRASIQKWAKEGDFYIVDAMDVCGIISAGAFNGDSAKTGLIEALTQLFGTKEEGARCEERFHVLHGGKGYTPSGAPLISLIAGEIGHRMTQHELLVAKFARGRVKALREAGVSREEIEALTYRDHLARGFTNEDEFQAAYWCREDNCQPVCQSDYGKLFAFYGAAYPLYQHILDYLDLTEPLDAKNTIVFFARTDFYEYSYGAQVFTPHPDLLVRLVHQDLEDMGYTVAVDDYARNRPVMISWPKKDPEEKEHPSLHPWEILKPIAEKLLLDIDPKTSPFRNKA